MELHCENIRDEDQQNPDSDFTRNKKEIITSVEVINSSVTANKTVTNQKIESRMKPQPTPEQVRIAEMITKNEDPKLKEKIKQVMDACQRTEEEAYLALHDSEYDPNRAVNLLLEGNIETEWSTSSKKKKPKIVGEKNQKTKSVSPREGTRKIESSEAPQRSLPRGYIRQNERQSDRGRNNFQYNNRGKKFNSRTNIPNNNNAEENDATVIESRTFERVIPPSIRPVDKWDPNRPIASMMNNRCNEMDEEEYTGSLSSSLVFGMSSDFSSQRKGSNVSVEPKSAYLQVEFERQMAEPKFFSKNETNVLDNVEVMKAKETSANESNDSSITCVEVSPSPTAEEVPVCSTMKMKLPPMGAKATKPLPVVDITQKINKKNSPITETRPKLSSGKIPSIPVEMPKKYPTVEASLDIQFGCLDLNESVPDTSNASPVVKETGPPLRSPVLVNLKENSPKVSLESEVSKVLKKSHQTPTAYGPYLNFSTSQNVAPNYSASSNHSTTSDDSFHAPPPSLTCGEANTLPSYGLYGTQTSQSIVPMMGTLPNNFPTILGAQSYTSQSSMYGGNLLPTSSFNGPYQSYCSALQQKPLVPHSTFPSTKEYEGGSHNCSSSSRSGVSTSSTNTIINQQSYPTTKSGHLHKNQILTNIHPLMGPQQHPVFFGQGGIQYFPTPLYYPDIQMLHTQQQQQRIASPMNTSYYDVGYPSLGREGIQYERVLPKQEGLHPHLPSGSDVFSHEAEVYPLCEVICESHRNTNQAETNQALQPGLGLIDTTSMQRIKK